MKLTMANNETWEIEVADGGECTIRTKDGAVKHRSANHTHTAGHLAMLLYYWEQQLAELRKCLDSVPFPVIPGGDIVDSVKELTSRYHAAMQANSRLIGLIQAPGGCCNCGDLDPFRVGKFGMSTHDELVSLFSDVYITNMARASEKDTPDPPADLLHPGETKAGSDASES